MVTANGLNLRELAKDFLLEQMKAMAERNADILKRHCKVQRFFYEGPIQVKERPRQGAGGRFYTPKDTVAYEKKVAEWGKRLFDAPIVYPIMVQLSFYDQTDDEELLDLALYDMTHSTQGDVDNYAKAVLDALNGVAWKDDKQINRLHVRRSYGNTSGFSLNVCRNGLTGAEYSTFCKYVQHFREQV